MQRDRRFASPEQAAWLPDVRRVARARASMSALLEVNTLAIAGVLELVPKRFGDDRGYFCEVYNRQRFGEETGTAIGFVQTKLVWVVRGAVFDVAVDIRLKSPTYGKWASALLSAEKGNQILVPAGF